MASLNDPNAGLTPDAKEAKFLYLALTTMSENGGRVSNRWNSTSTIFVTQMVTSLLTLAVEYLFDPIK